MTPMFVRLKSPDGRKVEAMAYKYHEYQRLPEGRWSVELRDNPQWDRSLRTVTDEADMPAHWQEQIRKACGLAAGVEE